MISAAEVLAADGLLCGALPGFRHRHQQAEMASAVERILDQGGTLICEAGTGTGKTFAYLVPALLSGRKVIISTGTRNLQDQLFDKDLPLVRKALAMGGRAALLKGRANYLCPHRLGLAMTEARLHSRAAQRELMRVEQWAARTRRGDIAELPGVPEDSQVWPLVTSTNDNCLGQECPQLEHCHVVEARRRAFEADLVVVNHHLLCADFALKADGFGELLPAADCIIVDEAHQLPEVAGNFFGDSLSARQLQELVRDTELEYQREAGDLPELPDAARQLETASRELRLHLGPDSERAAWSRIEADDSVREALAGLDQCLAHLGELLQAVGERGKGLENCAGRCTALRLSLNSLLRGDETDGEAIRWYETFRTGYRLNRTPLSVAAVFRERMAEAAQGWIFTSATLAVGDSFRHFQEQLGLEQAETARWDSPFDYPNQALWFVPRGLPQPNQPGYTEAVVEIAMPLIQASQGRTFLLFTSHRALRIAAELLDGQIEFPILVQGDASKAELLERFRTHGNAVLLGTSAFWEGVDVRGDALSCVVIDKLPFASPGDPVLQARLDAIRRRGGNPFFDYQLPQACIALKQGAGRLIRDVSDRGLLVVCDPRLLKNHYGHTFLASMPPMARTRVIEEAVAFFSLARLPAATE